jgi:ABC-type uncharacterized transport system substrate-binding protein
MAWIRGMLALAVASALLLACDWWLKRDAPAGRGKTWRLAFIQYIQSPEVDDAEAGVRAGLKESGLVEGEDYEITVRNASGDMPTILALIDAAMQDGADMLVTFSTPTLQAATNKTNRIPVVFTFVMDPVAAGAGRNYVDHRANVTGVYSHAPCDAILDSVRAFLPGVRSVGTLTVPAEVNSVYARDLLVAAAKKRDIEVVDLPLAAASDVPDAAAALCTRPIDAVVIVASNLTITAFPTIASAARRARLPVFGSTTSQFENGAVAVVANDFFDAGHGSGKLAARVMRGENPGAIPFQPTTGKRLLLNGRVAEDCGLTLPAALRDRADKVKE